MTIFKLSGSEKKFAEIVWANTPIMSPELVKLCEKEMNWKKSTTYTVLKKLCDKGIFNNENASISVKVTRDEFYAGQSRLFVDDVFGGSLPKFIASFVNGGKLSVKQAEELKQLIDLHREE